MPTRCSVLLAVGFIFITIGSALMWHFSYTSESQFLFLAQGTTAQRFRYDTCYFYFVWISSLVTSIFQRPNMMAITAGLLAAIITFNFSFQEMDDVRSTIKRLEDVSQLSSFRSELQKLAAGCILNYVGAGLSFIASVLVFRSKNSEDKSLFTKVTVVFVILFNFIGCVCIWQSSSLSTNPNNAALRSALFETTECTTAVGIVFLIGVICGIDHIFYFAAAISGFYNLSIIDTYLQFEDSLAKDAAAGTVMLWLSAVAIAVYCAISRGSASSYLALEGSSEV